MEVAIVNGFQIYMLNLLKEVQMQEYRGLHLIKQCAIWTQWAICKSFNAAQENPLAQSTSNFVNKVLKRKTKHERQ